MHKVGFLVPKDLSYTAAKVISEYKNEQKNGGSLCYIKVIRQDIPSEFEVDNDTIIVNLCGYDAKHTYTVKPGHSPMFLNNPPKDGLTIPAFAVDGNHPIKEDFFVFCKNLFGNSYGYAFTFSEKKPYIIRDYNNYNKSKEITMHNVKQLNLNRADIALSRGHYCFARSNNSFSLVHYSPLHLSGLLQSNTDLVDAKKWADLQYHYRTTIKESVYSSLDYIKAMEDEQADGL